MDKEHKACLGSGKCKCLKGYYGDKCDISISPVNCGGHGSLNPVGNCLCDEGYFGKECDCSIQCKNGGSCTGSTC